MLCEFWWQNRKGLECHRASTDCIVCVGVKVGQVCLVLKYQGFAVSVVLCVLVLK